MSSNDEHGVLATLGGGCFWCTEAVFQQVRGVLHVESGYIGGHIPQPDYESVCRGTTGHVEVVRIRFDPAKVTYQQILEIFFATHDPTTPDRQGNDAGPQYRSAIFTHDSAQRDEALRVISVLTGQRAFAAPIVTEVRPAETFWPAEPYHQNYFRNHPEQGYCAFVIAPKLAKFRKQFSEIQAGDA